MVRKIVLSLIAAMGLFAYAEAQTQQVSGTVLGPDGQPVAGATVMVDGTHVGTTSNADGSFTISAPSNGSLTVSFIGYQTQTVALAGKTRVNVSLKEDAQSIDDVIVVAFGTAKKEAFTGAAKMIKSDDLVKTQSSNVQDALVGKIAGVQFNSTSGRPGSGQVIRVRGIGSMNAGNSPLWVVDGVPYEGDINNLNSNDIESISVLKDAASNALYGARGANGVIMVTTKRAKAGDATVTFDAKWGINTRALQNYDIVEDAGEYYEMHYKSLYNYYTMELGQNALEANIAANKLLTSNEPGGLGYNVFTVPEGQNLIGENGRLNPLATEGRLVTDQNGNQFYLKPDNWLDELYKSASFRQEYNVSVSGATDRANFYASLGYLDNTGIIEGSRNERVTARLRADYQAKKWLKVGGNMSYTHFLWENGNRTNEDGNSQGEGNADGGNVFATAVRTAPIYPIYLRDGNGNVMYDKYGFKMYDFYDGRNGGSKRPSGNSTSGNDLQNIQLNKYKSEGNAFMANGYADFMLYKGLKLTVNGSMSLDETRGTNMQNPYYGQFAVNGGTVQKTHLRDITYNLQQLLSYNNTFAQHHNIDLLLGHEMYNRKQYALFASKSMMFSPDNDELSGMVVDGSAAGSYIIEYNNEGYFFRGQYDYDGKYFFSGSYRRDASSRFHPDHRWGNFWSVGAAWIINRENWFNAPWVDMLKVKLSYGSQGNDNLGTDANTYYYYTDYFSIENSGNGATTILSQKGNPDITWETNSNLNVGVEFGFWQNRLSGGIDFFNRKTTDMLFALPTPTEAGYTSIFTNIGDMVNRGVEIELNADLIRSKNLTWDFTLNMTHYKNELVRLPDQYKNHTTSDGKHVGRRTASRFYTEGESVYSFYLPTYAGVDPSTGKSMWYTYQENAAGEKERITTTDYSVASENGSELHGTSVPDLYGGFGTSLRFYGVDLSVGFTYQIGGMALDQGYMYYMDSPHQTSVGMNYHHDLLNSWTEQNSDSNIPRFAYNDQDQASPSDRFLTDASFLNIQNITLGYTLPKRITRKFLVENLRIYFSCDNVWYWSKRKGFDPRQSIGGVINPYYYAPIRTFSGGISVTF